MLMTLYSKCSSIYIIIVFLFILKYLYDEDLDLGIKKIGIIVGTYLACDIILIKYWSGYRQGYLTILIPMVVIFLSRKKHRIRGMFLVFVAVVTSFIPHAIISMIITTVTNRKINVVYNSVYLNMVTDVVLILLVIYIANIKKKYSNHFRLNIWEKVIIISTSTLSFFSVLLIEEVQNNQILIDSKKISEVFIPCMIIIIIVSVIVSITKNKSMNYYKNLSEINKHYIQTQLNHFESYKLSQEETRRVKHDMKNHMICINELCKNKKYKELSEYIEALQDTVFEIDKQIFTGSDIMDAIINEKSVAAKNNNIMINVDGKLNGLNNISPIDICTIISNAMDNAIESCTRCSNLEEKNINIKLKKDRNYILIEITNPVDRYINIEKNKIKTSKNDKLNHGFGLINMENAIKKYNGTLVLTCNEIYINKLYEFKLEIILPG